MNKEYKINIDPRILELLGPSMYTNIYYILAELIANAYDADAKNVYIFANSDDITVEDDGNGMSYSSGEVTKYLNVAVETRKTSDDALTRLGRRKMGRKGVGKLAALSISENVIIKTIKNGEKSGFILSRHVDESKMLKPISENYVKFIKKHTNGTSIVMTNPQYRLHKTLSVVKKNLLKVFPLVDENFVIHVIRDKEEVVINNFDENVITELSALITLGAEFAHLIKLFRPEYPENLSKLISKREKYVIPIVMKDKWSKEHEYSLEIKGWIGTYISTKGRKAEISDFPDNFISLYSNKKLGEFNILPSVGQNKLIEVYVVGQLHIDLFEETDLPDMALSNRQGYKSDDPRYRAVLSYVRETLLQDILKMRDIYIDYKLKTKKRKKLEEMDKNEELLRKSVDEFRKKASRRAATRIKESLGLGFVDKDDEIERIVNDEINLNSPDIGLKSIVDDQKKKILISQTYKDKDLADTIYNMLLFNNVPGEDIIYTNCDDEVSRIPEGESGKSGIYDYLRKFFVESYSTKKLFVVFVTSNDMKLSWGAVTEVGAAWITQIQHKIFNIQDFRPEHPLDDESQWHVSKRDGSDLCMSKLSCDIFAQKLEYICDTLGYKKRTRQENKARLSSYIRVI